MKQSKFELVYTTVAFLFLTWGVTGFVGCKGIEANGAKGIDASGIKGIDTSRETSNKQILDVATSAGDNSRITTINFVGQNSGWIVGGLTTLGWGTAWLGRRRSTKAVDRLVGAIETEDMHSVKARVKAIGHGRGDRTQACIEKRIRSVCK